MSTGEKFVPNK